MVDTCINRNTYLQTVCAGSAAGEIPSTGKYSMGLIPSQWPAGSQALPTPTDKEVPKRFDWMDKKYILSGKDSGTEPIQQGSCNSCFIVAPSTCLGDRIAIKLTQKGYDVTKPIVGGAVAPLSCACNFNTRLSKSKEYCGGKNGGDMLQSSEWLVNHYIPTNKCYPYPSLQDRQPPQLSCLSSFNKINKCACDNVNKSEARIKLKASSKDGQAIGGRRSLTSAEIKGLKEDIQANGPVTFGIWADSLQGHTTSQPDEPYPGGTPNQDGHAVVVTGWDDYKNAWRVRNSWGKGQNFWLSYGAKIIEIAIVTPDTSDEKNLVEALTEAGYIAGSSPGPSTNIVTPGPSTNIVTPGPGKGEDPKNTPSPSPKGNTDQQTTDWPLIMGIGALILVVGGITAIYLHKKTKKKKRR